MDIETEGFGEYSIEEIKQGYYEDNKGYICLVCGERFEKGEIYSFSSRLYEGRKAVQLHIQHKHGSIKETLLKMSANNLGISDLQLQLLNFFSRGLSDKEIAEYLGVSSSTIRNHRHKLREREKQNRLYLSLMELIKQDGFGRVSMQIDKNREDGVEENMISDRERKRILDKYMTVSGRLKSYPSYEKSKRVVLEAILINFYTNTKYTEQEVNSILAGIYKDYRLLKKELMAYNYLDRTNTGAIYWVRDYANDINNQGSELGRGDLKKTFHVVDDYLEQVAK